MTFMTRDLAVQEQDLNRAKTTFNWLLAALSMMLTETVSSLLASVLPRGVKVTMLLEGILMPLLVLKLWGHRMLERSYRANALLMSTAAFVVTMQAQEMIGAYQHVAMLAMIAALAGLLVFDRLSQRPLYRTFENEEGNRFIDLATGGSLAAIAIQWPIQDTSGSPLLLASCIGLCGSAMLISNPQSNVLRSEPSLAAALIVMPPQGLGWKPSHAIFEGRRLGFRLSLIVTNLLHAIPFAGLFKLTD